MIDIVFQLLVFFIMTFKIAAQEGDFSIRMPRGVSQDSASTPVLPPIVLRLTAHADGRLDRIYWTQRPIRDFDELRRHATVYRENLQGPGGETELPEIELRCDNQLKYDYVIQAITAVSGYRSGDSNDVIRLARKIRFSPPRQKSGD